MFLYIMPFNIPCFSMSGNVNKTLQKVRNYKLYFFYLFTIKDVSFYFNVESQQHA